MLRNVLLPGIFVYDADVMDRAADGIDQGCAAADTVFLPGQGFHFLQVHPVMDHGTRSGKQHSGYNCLSFHALLALNHTVETADRIRFQSGHGSALVEDENHFRQILPHCISPPSLIVRALLTPCMDILLRKRRSQVASQATIFYPFMPEPRSGMSYSNSTSLIS